MAIVQCSCGYYYDNEKNPICPRCSGQVRLEKMLQKNSAFRHMVSETEIKETIQTVDRGPVVGWLVWIKGEERGRDFRLYSGFNRFGRALTEDISIADPTVAYRNHCAIVYEPRKAEFFIVPGVGSSTWLNQERLTQSVPLKTGDRIAIGENELEFIPFCQKEHTWQTI